MPSQDAFLAGLEADLRALSNEARRSDSLAGQLTGWLSGPEHPAIKEAAERAMLKLRSTVDQGQGLEAIKGNKVCTPALPAHVPSYDLPVPKSVCSVSFPSLKPGTGFGSALPALCSGCSRAPSR